MYKTSAYVFAMLGLVACGGGGGSDSPAAPDPAPEPEIQLDRPPNVTLTNNGAEMTLTWDPVDSATGYNIYYAHEPITDVANYGAFTGSNLILDAEPPHTFTVSEIEPVYHVRVTATAGQVEGPPSAQVLGFPRYIEAGSDGQFVDDLVHEVRWNRCIYGQSWDSTAADCVGEPIRTYYEATREGARAEGANIPPIRALLSIMFCSSGNPRQFHEVGSVSLKGGTLHDSPFTGPDGFTEFRCQGDFDIPTVVTSWFPTPEQDLPAVTNLYWSTSVRVPQGSDTRIIPGDIETGSSGITSVPVEGQEWGLMARFARPIPD